MAVVVWCCQSAARRLAFVRLGLGLLGRHAEGDVPAERVFDEPGSGDPVLGVGVLADREVFGPAESDPTDLGQVDRAPAAVHPLDAQIPALRDVHRHDGPEACLELRGVRPALPAVAPCLDIRLEHRLRGLCEQDGEEVEVLAGLADRGVRTRERPLVLRHHLPPRVQQIPHRAGRVRLSIGRRHLGRRQRKPGTVPELPPDQGALTHQMPPIRRFARHSQKRARLSKPTGPGDAAARHHPRRDTPYWCTVGPRSSPLKGAWTRLPRKEYDTHARRYLWGGRFRSGSHFAGSCGGAPSTAAA